MFLPEEPVQEPDFLQGGGEMGALMRAHDWSGSSLGPPATWPQPLRMTVRLLLNTGHPMYIWWGEDGACLYNDAYRQSIGPERHPGSLGRPAREVWAEIWDIIGPQIEQVRAGRGATWHEDQLVPITRNGRREDVYWTYSYSPIDDETAPNGVGGVLVVCTETTQKVLAEQRLAAEMERQRRLFERAPSFIAILHGPEHVFEFVNEAYSRLVGGRPLTGRPVREALPEVEGQGFFELLDKVYATGERFVADHVPVSLRRAQDEAMEERFLDFVYEPVTDPSGTVTGIFVEGHDVTEQKRAEAALRESETRYRQIVEGAEDFAIIMLDEAGLITSWNSGAERLVGFTEAQAIGRPGAIFFTAEDQAAGIPDHEMNRAKEEGRTVNERWHVRSDGTRFWGSGLMMRLDAPGGGYLKMFRDRTAEHDAEAALRQTAEELQAVLDAVPAAIWIARDPESREIVGNRASYDLLRLGSGVNASLSADDAERPTGFRIFHDGRELAPAELPVQMAAAGRVVENFEEEVRFEDGTSIDLYGNATPLRDAEGRVRGAVAAFVDVTDAKRAEAALRESEARFREQFENANDFIFTADLEMRITSCNPAVAAALGHRPETLIGHCIAEFVPPEMWERNKAMLAAKLRGEQETTRYEVDVIAPDGGTMTWEINSRLTRDEAGSPTGLHAIGRDVSERKRADEALAARNRRLALLARIASGLTVDKDPQERLRTAFAEIAEEVEADYYFNFLIDEAEPTRMRLASGGGLSPEQHDAFAQIAVGEYLCGRVAKNREPVVIDDLDRSDDPACAGVIGLDGKSYAGFPLIAEGRLIGTISFASKVRSRFAEDQVALMATVADQIAAALDRNRIMAAVRESEERFRNMADHAPVMMWVSDPNGYHTYLNRSWHQFTGQTEAEAEGNGWLEAIHPDDKPEVERVFREANARREPFRLEYRLRAADGSYRWTIDAASPRFGAGGEFLGYVGSVIDINDRRLVEVRRSALVELDDRFRDLENPAEIAFAAAEMLGRTLDVSRAGYGTIDTQAETITIERDWNAPGIRSLAGVLRFRDYGSYIEDLKRGETVVFADAEKDPRTAATADALKGISAQSVVNMPVTEQGGLVALLYLNHAVAREWTAEELAFIREVAERTRTAVERRRAELELRESEARFRDLADNISPLAWMTRPDGWIVWYNKRWYNYTGTDFDTMQGWGWKAVHHPDHVERVTERFRAAVERGEPWEDLFPLRSKDGEYRWFLSRALPIRDENGRILRWFGTNTDITDQRRAEEALHRLNETLEEHVEERTRELVQAQEALRQSQKLEAMGQLTGGVAHDFNNLLTPIVGSLDLLQRRGLGGEREKRLIDGALQSAERAKTLVQRLLAFARRQPLKPMPVDVGALVTGMADLVASTSGPQVRVIVDVAADLPAATADPNQLEMAILNLSVNARDAMPDGGTLTITAARETVAAGHRAKLKPGDYVRLSVADTGMGMTEETLRHAIEPFFSTKGIGKGTGLGLSMVHGLASQLGGALLMSSKPGLGTNVELWLPVSDGPVEADEHHDDALPDAKVIGTALLVDDEELVRMSTADMLAEMGFAVVEAASGEEALRLIESGCAPDLLVTDHLMPGMTGADLARAVRNRRPDMPVLIVSGYAEAEAIAPDLPRLTKPFRQADLAASILQLRGTADA